jgi:hypothetical protein
VHEKLVDEVLQLGQPLEDLRTQAHDGGRVRGLGLQQCAHGGNRRAQLVAGIADELPLPRKRDVQTGEQVVQRVSKAVELVARPRSIQSAVEIALADRIDGLAHLVDRLERAADHGPDEDAQERAPGDEHHPEQPDQRVTHARNTGRGTCDNQRAGVIDRRRFGDRTQIPELSIVHGDCAPRIAVDGVDECRPALGRGAGADDPSVGRQELDVQVGRPRTRGQGCSALHRPLDEARVRAQRRVEVGDHLPLDDGDQQKTRAAQGDHDEDQRPRGDSQPQ